MNVIRVWAYTFWSSDAVEHEHYHGFGMDAVERELGMDALVIRCGRTSSKGLLNTERK